jgi:hypothetical protein
MHTINNVHAHISHPLQRACYAPAATTGEPFDLAAPGAFDDAATVIGAIITNTNEHIHALNTSTQHARGRFALGAALAAGAAEPEASGNRSTLRDRA